MIFDDLDLGEYGEDFANDYDLESIGSEYISDMISEFADGCCSIYYSDIKKWAADHFDEITDAIDEFGWDGCGSDLYKATQMAQYMVAQNNLYSHLQDVLAKMVEDYVGDVELTDEQISDLYDLCDGNYNTFDELKDEVDDYLASATAYNDDVEAGTEPIDEE